MSYYLAPTAQHSCRGLQVDGETIRLAFGQGVTLEIRSWGGQEVQHVGLRCQERSGSYIKDEDGDEWLVVHVANLPAIIDRAVQGKLPEWFRG